MTKEEFDADPRYNGQPTKHCSQCQMQILPWGRSAPMEQEMFRCKHESAGSLWPGETREDFGYTAELVEEAAKLRAEFYPDQEVDDDD